MTRQSSGSRQAVVRQSSTIYHDLVTNLVFQNVLNLPYTRWVIGKALLDLVCINLFFPYDATIYKIFCLYFGVTFVCKFFSGNMWPILAQGKIFKFTLTRKVSVINVTSNWFSLIYHITTTEQVSKIRHFKDYFGCLCGWNCDFSFIAIFSQFYDS